jgi:parallel beta-helix repeat protein
MRIFTISFLLVLFLFPFAITQARIIHVPADSSCIQCAINGAVDGDTVLVARGHYYERINFRGKAVLVTSNFSFDNDTNTIDSTIIDGDSLVGDTGSVVLFVSGEDSNSVIKAFTIQNGIGTANPWDYRLGGGVYCYYSSPTISNNTVAGNSGTFGGGIFCDHSSAVIGNNTITGNFASDNGGGVLCEFSSPIFKQNIIRGNSSDRDGGGIDCGYYSSSIIHNNIITGNFAAGQPGGSGGAGGIYIHHYSDATVTNNTITGNSTTYYGAGVYCEDSRLVLENNTITGNSASDGGGICCAHLLNPSSISNNTVSGNRAIGRGGGIYLISSTPTVRNNTITDNSARDGGGIHCSDSSPLIINNTIVGNLATERGGGIGCAGYSSPTVRNNIISNSLDGEGITCEYASYPTISYNDVWNNADGNFHGCPPGVGDFTWGTNLNGTSCDSFYNISCCPLFCYPDTGNYYLNDSSCCKGAGCDSLGEPDSTIDIGAFGVGCGYVCGDATGNGIVDIGDVVYLINYLFIHGPAPVPLAAGDATFDGVVDVSDVVYLINYLFVGGPAPCQL